VAEILIIGAGIAGLGAALGLEAQGNTVTIIEQDPPAPTTSGDAAFEMWDRRNVPQFRQAHGFSARSRTLLLKYAPGVVARLAADGIVESNAFKLVAPPEIHEPDDDAFTGFMTRRPAFELALRLEAEDRPRIGFMCPETVSGLSFADAGPTPVVNGVRLANDSVVHGDVVLDCGGRRSRVGRWLEAAGVSIEETVQDSGITYFTRYFRKREASPLPIAGIFGIRTVLERLVVLGFPGDHDTYGVTMAAASWDDQMRDLRHDKAWDRVASSVAAVAPWVARENAVSLGPVATMTGHRNVLRDFMPNGQPAVLGLLAIGDALCTTNPTYGWGASMALTYAFAACDAIAEGTDDLRALAFRYDRAVGAEAADVYAECAAGDRIQLHRWHYEPIPESDADEAERQSLIEEGVLPGIMRDALIARAFLRRVNLVESPRALFENAEVLARAEARRDKNRARAATAPSMTLQDIHNLIALDAP